jgi:hypothetical protein
MKIQTSSLIILINTVNLDVHAKKFLFLLQQTVSFFLIDMYENYHKIQRIIFLGVDYCSQFAYYEPFLILVSHTQILTSAACNLAIAEGQPLPNIVPASIDASNTTLFINSFNIIASPSR